MFVALTEIKKLREKAAHSNVTRERDIVNRHVNAIERIKQELKDYQLWRAEEELTLYSSIKGEDLTLPELDTLKHKIRLIRLKEEEFLESIEEEEHKLSKAKKKLIKVEKVLQEARQAVEKIETIAEEVTLEAKAQIQKAEDNELDETSATLYSLKTL